jgi:hypothetical protein
MSDISGLYPTIHIMVETNKEGCGIIKVPMRRKDFAAVNHAATRGKGGASSNESGNGISRGLGSSQCGY